MSEIIKYRQSEPLHYDIQDLALKEFNAAKVKLFTEEDSRRLKEEAERSLRLAEEKAAKAIKDAEEEARTLIVLAERKVEDFRKEGLRQGYEEGLKKAEEEMEDKYSRAFEDEAGKLRDFMQGLKDAYADAIKTAEAPLVKLALDIAEKVIKEEAAKSGEVVLANIRDSLQRLTSKVHIVVRVNPDQFDLVDEHKQVLIRAIEGINDFELVADHKVDKGGCIIETPSGNVEARIAKQIKELKKVITGQDKEDPDVSENT